MLRWLAASLGLGFAILALACEDSAVAQPCTNVPSHGCPLAHGVACEDPRCEAIYACREGNVWERVKSCPGYDAQAELPIDAGPPGSALDAAVDAPPGAYGGPGCALLQEPDCALGLALACTTGCCGCEDLYVCTNTTWEPWGQCSPDGGIRSDP